MSATTTHKEPLAATLIGQWDQIGRKIADIAEQFPEDKYESRLVDGARTFGEVLRHLAFWNRYVADTARGRQADESANELPISDYPTKARIVKEFNRSTASASAALKEQLSGLPEKTAELAVSFIGHSSEHYGQLAVYSRLAGIAPPASRG